MSIASATKRPSFHSTHAFQRQGWHCGQFHAACLSRSARCRMKEVAQHPTGKVAQCPTFLGGHLLKLSAQWLSDPQIQAARGDRLSGA